MARKNKKKEGKGLVLGLGVGGTLALLGFGLAVYRLREREKVYNALRNMYNTQLIDAAGTEYSKTIDGKKFDYVGQGVPHLGLFQIMNIWDLQFAHDNKKSSPANVYYPKVKEVVNMNVDDLNKFFKKLSKDLIPIFGLGSAKSTILKKQKNWLKFNKEFMSRQWPQIKADGDDTWMKTQAESDEWDKHYFRVPGPVYKDSDFTKSYKEAYGPDFNHPKILEEFKSKGTAYTHPWLHSNWVLNPENYIGKSSDHIKKVILAQRDSDKDLST